jgi:hypothetical protein
MERVVWRTTNEMHERNYRKYYRSFESFNNLVQLFTPYLRSKSKVLVRS